MWDAITAISAFLAVGVAIWVASRQTRETRQQLRRQAIADIHVEAYRYSAAAGEVLNSMETAAGLRPGSASITAAKMAELREATIRVDRALTFAEMTCTEGKMTEFIVNAQSAQRQFLTIVNAATTPPTGAGQIGPARFAQPAADAEVRFESFNTLTAAIAVRGRELYSLERERKTRKTSDLGDMSKYYLNPVHNPDVLPPGLSSE